MEVQQVGNKYIMIYFRDRAHSIRIFGSKLSAIKLREKYKDKSMARNEKLWM